jgi:hypothetical protein
VALPGRAPPVSASLRANDSVASIITANSTKTEIWLHFLNTYRTMCLAPGPEFQRILEGVGELRRAA